MDIRLERSIIGSDVVNIQTGTASAAIAVGTLVTLTGGQLAALADAGQNAVGFTVSATTAAGQEIEFIPFVPGVTYSVPVIANVAPGDNLEYDLTTDAFVESATAPMARAWFPDQDSGALDERTYLVVIAGLYFS